MDSVKIPLKRFLLVEECPPEWKAMDLYLFRDGPTVFYVGQSHSAFRRVWRHILSGYKARSDAGRFLLCNWPKSMNFEIELFSSRSPAFRGAGGDPALAEAMLIRRHRPCFNAALNAEPVSLPAGYLPPNAPIRCSRRIKQLQYQAAISINNDEKENWIDVYSDSPPSELLFKCKSIGRKQ
jgi:hypothetical protein